MLLLFYCSLITIFKSTVHVTTKILHVSCYTAVTYQWYRASDGDFVRPDLNPRAFISSNGKLYFSEVTQSDATDYICLVKLAGSNIAKLATEQPPSTISRPITLDVLFAGNQ